VRLLARSSFQRGAKRARRARESATGRLTSTLGLALLVGSLVLTSGEATFAAEVRVQVARGPYYIGEGFEIQVVATNFAEEPAPEVSTGVYAGGVLRLLSVSPSTSTSISIINGKMTRVHEVTFVYRYEFTGTRKGRLRIPEFVVTQEGESESTRSFNVDISGVPTTDLVSVELEWPEGPIFVGQKVPVALEFRIDRQTQRDLVSYQLHVPLFDSPTLRFLDNPLADFDTHLEVQTEAGVLRLPAVSRETTVRGRSTLILRAERTMIAVSPESIAVEASRVFISQGAGFRRDIFKQRRATTTEKFMATGRPVRIEVGEVPRKDRPPSFAGAVGKGFSLEVSADRSVVQLGEPILLSFHLRGDGDLSSASLPPLDAEGLLDSSKFRLPEDSPAGIVDEDGKHFDVTLRVLDAGVREIPALAYSWFDAKTRSFETTRSRPIALSVGAAEIIGAEAVARRGEASGEALARALEDETLGDAPVSPTIRSTSLALSGANLGVERNVSRLLRDERIAGSRPLLHVGLYSAGLAFLFFAFVDARRRGADPMLLRRAAAFKKAKQAMEASFLLSEMEVAAALGRALRELVAELPNEAGPAFDRLISECDTLRFARGAGASTFESGVSDSLRERARQLVDERMRSVGSREEGTDS